MSDRRRKASDLEARKRKQTIAGSTAYGYSQEVFVLLEAHKADVSNPHEVTIFQARAQGGRNISYFYSSF